MIDYSTDDLALWFAWLILAGVLAYQATDCGQYTQGADIAIECETGEPLDLTPTEGE